MLVCSVSQFRRRAAIAAGLTEAATALDAATTGNIVFATLVDDPAAVTDRVDAYLGEIMLEPANAAETVNAGLIYAIAMVEPANAADLLSAFAIGIVVGAVVEATAAADTQDATVTSATVAMSAMMPDGMVNSDGTARQANVNGTMVNL